MDLRGDWNVTKRMRRAGHVRRQGGNQTRVVNKEGDDRNSDEKKP